MGVGFETKSFFVRGEILQEGKAGQKRLKKFLTLKHPSVVILGMFHRALPSWRRETRNSHLHQLALGRTGMSVNTPTTGRIDPYDTRVYCIMAPVG
jgi:hypothetical protein